MTVFPHTPSSPRQLTAPWRSRLKLAVVSALGSPVRINGRLRKLAQTDLVTILNLHQVHPEPGPGRTALRVELFEELLKFVNKHFDLRTFSNLSMPSNRPRMVISFDDGYRDFIDYAVPLLRKYAIPANQNIIPANAESGLPPLNVLTRQFVAQAPAHLIDRIKVPGLERKLSEVPLQALSNFLKNRSQVEQLEIADALIPQFFEWNQFKPIEMMTPSQIREVCCDYEIGGHSYSHASMAFETDAFLRDDVAKCQKYFEVKLGQPMKVYAFPNGSCRPEQIETLLAVGVDHVLLAGRAFDRGAAVHSRFNFDARSRNEVRYEAVGGLERIKW
jgi:peptidoglycan/xylan/chitin deacetylase (PgdA/CDA1 family)